jgi:hypothetical protein
MTGANHARSKSFSNTQAEAEEAERVGDGNPASSDAKRHLLLRKAELVDQPAKGFRLLQWVEVGTLDILDKREFQSLDIPSLPNHYRNSSETRLPSRLKPPMTGYKQISTRADGNVHPRNNQRLQNAVATHAFSEIVD